VSYQSICASQLTAEPDGLTGDVTTSSRPLKTGESMEWILLSGVCHNRTQRWVSAHSRHPLVAPTLPCTICTQAKSIWSFRAQIVCTQALRPFTRSSQIDGRNSSTAFALSSGTLGAALAATLSIPLPGPSSGPSLHTDHIPCIAVSYGVVTRPVASRALELANDVSVDVCAKLWDDWGYEDDTGRRVQIYSINVPLVVEPLEKDRRKVCWTDMWRNAYGQLFKTTKL
jgi:tubulin--tyrosine ligase